MLSQPQPEQKSLKAAQVYTTFKFLRACDNCRLRKIKCVMKQSCCENCRSHKLECCFENRILKISKGPKGPKQATAGPQRTQKRQASVDAILSSSAEQRRLSETSMGLSSPPLHPSQLMRGSPFPTQSVLRPHSMSDVSPPAARLHHSSVLPGRTNAVMYEYGDSPEHIVHLYKNYVEPLTPYVHIESINKNRDLFSACCVKIAASHSVTPCPEPMDNTQLMETIHACLAGIPHWTLGQLSCFFLLPAVIPLSQEAIESALERFLELYNSVPDIPINVAVAAMSVDAWNALFTSTKLKLPTHMFQYFEEFLRFADDSLLHYHLAELNHHLIRFLSLTEDQPHDYNATRKQLLQLEYDILLLPVKLPKQFLVVKDRLVSTKEAFLYHVLHNAFLVSVYTRALTSKIHGKMLSIYAIAGLYHFLCGLVESTLKIEDKAGLWSLVSDCMVHSLKCGLELIQVMDFDDLVLVMGSYKERPNVRFPFFQRQLLLKARVLCENSPTFRDMDRVDGSLVFWVFRDVRSMTLTAYLKENS